MKTHPTAEERYDHILENARIPNGFDRKHMESIKENAKYMGEFLENDLSDHYELYDFYGSCYLAAPDTEWRGKQLIDRVDYY